MSAACPWLPLQLEILGNEHRLARVRRWAVDAQRYRAADHHLGQLRRGRLLGFARADRPPPVNHGDAVADGRHLAQLVRNEDDRIATLPQPVEHVVELVDLLRGQQRGRLVQDQRLPALIQRAQNLHPLLHPDREGADDRIGINVKPILIGELGDPLPGRLAVEHDPRSFGPENDVLGHGEAGDEHEVLVDHRQPGEHGIARALEPHRLTVDPDLALVRVVEPEQDVHQGRFAGAVLAQQRVDLAATNGELDAVVGDDSGESLDDPPHLDRRRGAVAVPDRHDRERPHAPSPGSSRERGWRG